MTSDKVGDMSKQDTEIRQAQIAEVVFEQIRKKGVKGLSMAAIAKRVGLVPSAIYRHFASKDEMLAAAIDLIRQRFLKDVQKARGRSDNPLEQLHYLFEMQLRMVSENFIIPRIFHTENTLEPYPVTREKVGELFSTIHGNLGDIVVQGQRAGVIRGDVDRRAVVPMFIGMFKSAAAIVFFAGREKFDMELHLRDSWKLFSSAVSPNKTAPTAMEQALATL